MKQVELIRQRVAKGLNGELVRLRIWMSGVEGNEEEVEKLRGKECELVLATLVESLLSHLGWSDALTTQATGRASESKARRVASRFRNA